MKKNSIARYFVILFSFVFVISSVIIGNYVQKVQTMQNTIETLEEQNRELTTQKEFELIKAHTKADEDKQLNGYLTWKEAKSIADRLTKESDGRFKREWGLFMANEATRHGVDPFLVYELLKVETGGTFNPELTGPETKYGRAYGLSQFMKNTAPWIADMAEMPYKDELLFDPIYSIQLSIVYLDFLHQQYEDWDKALTAYHRGIYGMEKFIEENGHAKSWYAEEIQTNAEETKLISYAD